MNRLDCIYVVQTIALVDDPQLGRAILMEYVNGRTLDKFVAEKHSLSERRRVAEELMEALIFLHERQIVHGDLKTSNILISDSGNHVRLIDFGFADNEAYIAKNIGTSPSISTPEQLPTDILLPERDIYALGKMLALLFPHSAKPVIRCCTSSTGKQYVSVRQVRAALHRLRLLRWLLPMLVFGAVAAVCLLCFRPQKQEVSPVVEHHTDTVVVMQPVQAVDSAWLDLKDHASKRYNVLYRTYADSIKNMPEKSFEEALELHNRYATAMYNCREQLIRTHPQYEEPLYEHYSVIYNRDYTRITKLFKDFPFTKSE